MKHYDQSISFTERIEYLVDNLTLEEKVGQLVHDSKAIERLNISPYNWWNEALHGVARAGITTVFPQPIAFGATFDKEQILEVASVISTEGRAKHNIAKSYNDYGIYKGLTYWSPNINIFRDPRWGRGHETYGEDPYLTAKLGEVFVRGLQGDDPKYLKAVATPKHYAVHSGPESKRHIFDACVSDKDLHETYLYAFKHAVQVANAEGIMAAYNKVNHEACCASDTLLNKTLREKWGFKGHVVSDCNGLIDLHTTHKITNSLKESAVLALNNGCDLNCGYTFNALIEAVNEGLIGEDEVNKAFRRVYMARFKLGMFDNNLEHPYEKLGFEDIATKEHQELSKAVIYNSSVLLKNDNSALPLKKTEKVCVIGPNADDAKVILGNYHGTPAKTVTVLEGINQYLKTDVRYSPGCEMLYVDDSCMYADAKVYFSEALTYAKASDTVVMVMGLSPLLEGEEGDATNADASGDRLSIELPQIQKELIDEISKLGKKVVLVLINGGPVTITAEIDKVDAVLECWYPGGLAGEAIAKMLYGEVSPQGKMPITVAKSIEDLPDFSDYAMKNRTYKYIEKEPLYPFGYGLSYSDTSITSAEIIKNNREITIKGKLTNAGDYDLKETVQVYLKVDGDTCNHKLIDFEKIYLSKNEEVEFKIILDESNINYFNDQGEVVVPSEFTLFVGISQPDEYSEKLTGKRSYKFVVDNY